MNLLKKTVAEHASSMVSKGMYMLIPKLRASASILAEDDEVIDILVTRHSILETEIKIIFVNRPPRYFTLKFSENF